MPDFEADGGRARDMRGVLSAGTTLRGYELKSILGQGAFGITYRALDTTLHRDVAIKEYLPTSLAVREGRTTVMPRSSDHAEQFAWGLARFVDEARTLARFDRTPAIVRVLDFLEANGTAYMVMALVEGETLNKRLMREQRLAPHAVGRILDPLLAGLEALHAATYLHRDIKPANIMLDSHGLPTLIDFGASRAAMAERSTTMTAVFTPGYAAAEQFVVSARLGPSTDIYGLSATLYHAITGRIPPSAVERILNDTYQPLIDLQPDGYPPALLAGLDAGLATRAADRPQSIGEWRALLGRGALAVSGEAATWVMRKPGRLARMARRTRRARLTIKGPALWGATAVALLVLGGGGYYTYRANVPASVDTVTLGLTAEQLEQALAERRKADALAAEKRRLEEEAQRKADVDAEAKRMAEAELVQAREARQKAEQELAALKTEIEARQQANAGQHDQAEVAVRRAAEEAAQQKAEAEATALRQAEEEAQKKAAAEAETKRQADEALAKAQAERQRAEEEARQKAEAAATAKADADATAKQKAATNAAAQRKAAEAAENTLRLEPTDRQRIQVALTSLGFDTRGSDGVFGPRSREMIAAWQQKAGAPATGFLVGGQRDALLSAAAVAVTSFDEARRRAEDEKRLAAEAAAPPAVAAVTLSPAEQAVTAPSVLARFNGTYSGDMHEGIGLLKVALSIDNGRGTITIRKAECGSQSIPVVISPAGEISGQGIFNCLVAKGGSEVLVGPMTITGRYADRRRHFILTFSSDRASIRAAVWADN